MDKTDALLCIERIREGIRALPDDVSIYGWQTGYNADHRATMTDIHLVKPVKWAEVRDGKEFESWAEKQITVTPFVTAWWGVDVDHGEDS